MNEIETLQAENDRLRQALNGLKYPALEALNHLHPGPKLDYETFAQTWDNLRAALHTAFPYEPVQTESLQPHAYIPTPGNHKWRTCDKCGQGANAKIHNDARQPPTSP